MFSRTHHFVVASLLAMIITLTACTSSQINQVTKVTFCIASVGVAIENRGKAEFTSSILDVGQYCFDALQATLNDNNSSGVEVALTNAAPIAKTETLITPQYNYCSRFARQTNISLYVPFQAFVGSNGQAFLNNPVFNSTDQGAVASKIFHDNGNGHQGVSPPIIFGTIPANSTGYFSIDVTVHFQNGAARVKRDGKLSNNIPWTFVDTFDYPNTPTPHFHPCS